MQTISALESDLTRLNQQFGAPGRVSFATGPNNLPIVRLASPFGSAEVSIYGAQVLRWRPIGHAPVLYLSPNAIYEPGKAIRGGIPICFPCFGKKDQLPQHGFARTTEWRVVKSSYDKEFTQIVLELNHSQETLKHFPYRFQARVDITLGRTLFLEFSVFNLDEVPFTYTEALHAYFAVAHVSQTELPDFGIKNIKETIDQTIPIGADGLSCDLLDQQTRRRIHIEADDCTALQIWNPYNQLPDLPINGYQSFLCVEPGNINQSITLKPTEQHTLTLRLRPELA